MRIAVVCEYFHPDNSGTTPSDMSELVLFLKHQFTDIEIDVIASRNLYRPAGAIPTLPRRENWQGIGIVRLQTPKSNRASMLLRLLAGMLFSGSALWCLMWRRSYDLLLIVTNPPTNAATAYVYRKFCGIPYIYFINDLFPDVAVALGRLDSKSWSNRIIKYFQNRWLNSAARVVVVGRCMRQHLDKTYKVPLEKMQVIRNWADPCQIFPCERQNEFRLNNRLTGFLALYGGNFSHYVNFDQILKAAKILAANEEITFVLIGGGVRKREIVERVEREQLKNVRVLPAVPRAAMNEVLAAADVSLVSLDPRMLGLGSPGKLYSILASGRPVIAMVSPASEVAQILVEEQCGVNVPDGDADALTRAIVCLKDDTELSTSMGENARRALERRFTLKQAGTDFYKLFREVLGNR